jgi:hypothetical protein
MDSTIPSALPCEATKTQNVIHVIAHGGGNIVFGEHSSKPNLLVSSVQQNSKVHNILVLRLFYSHVLLTRQGGR